MFSISEGSVFLDYLGHNSSRCFCVEVGKLLPVHRNSVDNFFILLWEYWVLTENKIPLKPVLGGTRIVALSICFHEQNQLSRVCCFLILYVLNF